MFVKYVIAYEEKVHIQAISLAASVPQPLLVFPSTELKDTTFGCDRVTSPHGPAAVSLAENPKQHQFYTWLQTHGINKKEKAMRMEQKIIWGVWDQFNMLKDII